MRVKSLAAGSLNMLRPVGVRLNRRKRTPLLQTGAAVAQIVTVLNADSPLAVAEVRRDIQRRISDHAGILCHGQDFGDAHEKARALNRAIAKDGRTITRKFWGGKEGEEMVITTRPNRPLDAQAKSVFERDGLRG